MNMKVILRTRDGYINSESNIKICKRENASVFTSISDALQERDRIYSIEPMIGRIVTEMIRWHNRRDISWIVRSHYREVVYSGFCSIHEILKGGQKLPTNQPPNETNHLIE